MKKELRLLLIEDMVLDAELIEHELRRGGFHFRAKRVETKDQFLHELQHHTPDLILSDHGIPAFDGFTALATARQRCPQVPFIFVTGAHGDEVAVETLKRGADDYVLKSRLHLLAPAIERALRQAAERSRHRQAEAALRQSEQQFRLLAEAAKDYALFTLNLDGYVVDWTAGAERITGHSPAEAAGRNFAALFPREDQDKARQAFEQAARQGHHGGAGWRLLRKGGVEFPAAMTLATPPAEPGQACKLICILHDLTRQKQEAEEAQLQAERTIRHRIAQAEADYRELQALTYTLALDLRTPLRHIDGFVDLLRKTASDQLDPKSQSSLKTIADSAHQMGRLIDELLTFSRIGQTQMYRLHFSLADIVKEVLQELRRETEGRRVEWVVGDLPEVIGDPAMLSQALTNLLSNALKFTRPRKLARIEIGCSYTDREAIVFVADNGVGFDPRHMDKLFGVFQKLHPADQFEGLGVGLANVRRIVQRHGGRTWAEGTANQGATFYFSLPRPAATPQEEVLDT